MSTATLNVWITAFGDPCHIVKPQKDESWFVHVLDCDGRPVEWCGRRYLNIPAKCGHAEFALPPGCYAVMASHTFVQNPANGFGNRLTHVSVVRVNCGDHACVTLFSPSAWHCGTWFANAIQGYAGAGALNRDLVERANEAIAAVIAELPEDPFAKGMQAIDTKENRAYVFDPEASEE